MDYNLIVSKINEHLKNSSKRYYSDFYIGITDNIERRLFGEHNVSKQGQWYIHAQADNIDIARDVEKHFLDKGMQGDDGGGNDTSVYVYCYEVTQNTIE